jgi:hypothetical protein
MSFDNSRSTFHPWRDYFGVVMQQGRVQLDSDWNEWLAEFARRVQAGTLDILGVSGVPSTTPSGFKITATNAPSITIGPGRIYVDGLLAENHGAKKTAQWDPALAEWSGVGQTPTDYTQQPYLPGASIPGSGPYLVYLDVWQRDITYLQDPDLVEKAIGVDTTGRRQTVWQVKLLDVSSVTGGVTCATSDSGIKDASSGVELWENVIQPSPSLLTTGVVALAATGPCAVNPATGYTGLENQFYRVEIHLGGSAVSAAGSTPVATFKWSRDNASVATTVVAKITSVTNSANNNASQLSVQSMGRDQVLGFSPGDWIEITDDYLELNGLPGELHNIVDIDSTAKTITLDAPVSTASFTDGSGTNIRIQRWDQAGKVYLSDGVTLWVDLDAVSSGAANGSQGIPVPPLGTTLILENGVTVSFNLGLDPSGNGFRAGDFWTFAARTADGSVESLTNAAPFGIYHHYCRLSVVYFSGSSPTFTDCRQLFPALANPAIHVNGVYFADTQILNNGTGTIQDLVNGITVLCDAPVDPGIVPNWMQAATPWVSTVTYNPGQAVTNGGAYYVCTAENLNQIPPNPAFWSAAPLNSPICVVTVDLPAPAANGGGFSPLILPATVSVGSSSRGSSTINWMPVFPNGDVQTALESQFPINGPPVLAHLTLKGNSIWAQGNPNVYLNGAVAEGSPDGRASADFNMWFWLTSQPPVTLSATNLAFSTQNVGTTSPAQSFTLTYNGTSTLTIASITATGDFAVTNTCGGSVAAGASCTITVTFTPTATGPQTGQITITENADPSPLVVTLSGTGIAPGLTVSPPSLNFGVQAVGTLSAQQTLTLTSSGTSQVTITNIGVLSLTGAGGDYSQSSNCVSGGGTGTLQPGQQCTIEVQFTPSATGTRSAELIIAHDAGNLLVVPLTGSGIPGVPAINASATSLSFGTVLVGSSGSLVLTLSNSGNAQLSITGTSITGANAASFSLTSTCGNLQPNQTCTITVVFRPAGAGAESGQLVISHNAAGSPLTIPLSGTGLLRKVFDKIADKITDKVAEKVAEITKTTDIKTADKVRDIKAEELVRAASSIENPAEGAPEAGAEGGTQKAFISPEERPAVGPSASGEPENEPPTEEPNKE